MIISVMSAGAEALQTTIETLRGIGPLLARRSPSRALGVRGGDQALIAHLKLHDREAHRDRYGPRSGTRRRLLIKLGLQLEELEASATEDAAASEPRSCTA